MNRVAEIYELLLAHFGPQNWWPGDTPFEIVVGAILTQNTAWTGVEKAIKNLKRENLLGPRKLLAASTECVEQAIRPSGYFRLKTKRLLAFCEHLARYHRGSMARMARTPTLELREELLGIYGIGPETADDILLYACGKAVFVVDAYTRRIFSRHGLVPENMDYESLRAFFEQSLSPDVALFKEYHGLIV